jgi:SpoIID/LytB domain protein
MAVIRRLIHVALITLGVMALLAAGLVYQAQHAAHPADNQPVRLHSLSVPSTSVSQQQQLRHEVPPDAAKRGGADTVVAMLSERRAAPFTMLGVTWASGLTPEHVYVEAKWRAHGQWSSWTALDIEPDAARIGRPGTEPQWVGGNGVADAAAVRVTSTAGAQPQDVKLVTINPGTGTVVRNMALSQPAIVSRATWGAAPQTPCDSPIYGTTMGAVIHHTAGSNTYTSADSPGIVRGIQAYHMDAKGWCDIGYNFLIDQYGTIFEGRSGGIDKAVRAAHSGNADVNLDTVGVALMGEFSSTSPTPVMKDSTAKLVAWRFSLAGLPAKGSYAVGGLTLQRIAGHRDVVSTECPGAAAYSWVTGAGGLRDAVASRLAAVLPAPANMHLDSTSDSSITWAWSAVSGVSRYEIEASSSSSFSTHESRYVTGTSYRWGFSSEGTFYAKVRGVDAAGVALTAWSTVAPGSPVAPPANMHVSTTSDSSISWAWSAVPGMSRYEIEASSSSSFSTHESRYVTAPAYTWGFSSEGTFYAKVRAVDAAGAALTGWSAVASGSPVSVLLAAPANMRVSSTGLTSVTWAWNAVSGVSQYELMATSSSSFATSESRRITGTSYQWGFSSDYLFYAKVRGVDSAGKALTSWSTVASGSPTKGDRVTSLGTSLTFAGHGYGHGIGLSQYGAGGGASQGAKYADILNKYYPGTAMGSTSGDISVRIMGDDSTLAVAPQSGLVFRSLSTGSTRTIDTTYGGQPISQVYLRPTPGKETTSSDLMVQTSAGSTSLGSYSGDAQFEASTIQLKVGSAQTTYRSKLRSVRPTGSASRYTLNLVTVEDYVRGVITKEMPYSWPTEALRAQAVAARTYGVYDRTSGDKYYNTCDSTACQVYGGKSAETSAGNAAVDATASQIRTYGGATAFTQFSSSSGGYTNSGSQPYLKPVEDDAWDSWSSSSWSPNPNHNWSVAVSVSTIESKLGITDLSSISITARNGYGDYGGRAVTVVFTRSSGATITKSGPDVRSMLGLKSDWFKFL